MRIRSGNIRQEGIILLCFVSNFLYAGFICKWFWSTINNNFNDVKHQIKEYKISKCFRYIDYDYNIYQTNYKGKGTYIQASETEMFILSQDKVLSLKDTLTESNTFKNF
jgi:inner membrane protein